MLRFPNLFLFHNWGDKRVKKRREMPEWPIANWDTCLGSGSPSPYSSSCSELAPLPCFDQHLEPGSPVSWVEGSNHWAIDHSRSLLFSLISIAWGKSDMQQVSSHSAECFCPHRLSREKCLFFHHKPYIMTHFHLIYRWPWEPHTSPLLSCDLFLLLPSGLVEDGFKVFVWVVGCPYSVISVFLWITKRKQCLWGNSQLST